MILGARDRSIRRRLMRVVMTTTLVALLMSATSLMVYELQSHRANWTQDLLTQAHLVAQASAPALAFDDPVVATENLGMLKLRPQIEAATIYDAQGRQFARFTSPGQPALPLTMAAAAMPADGNDLELRQPISTHGEVLGTVVLRAHYDVLPRLLDYLAILGAVTAASLGLAALVAQRLQRAVTEPVIAVASVAREVVQQRNYELRAPKTTDDEVGTLVVAFNDMLSELGGQAAALQAADRRKDEFLATLAHELRNPLAPVSTALAILERPDTDPGTRLRLVAMMQRQMKQFVRLIDDLMEVSRISTGRLDLKREPLDLVEVLRGAVEAVTPALLEQRHTLRVHWPAPIRIDGDRTRLGQVFVNLLGNAAKYTDPGGRIELSVRVLRDAVEVRIADNGIGIAPDKQREVFEMFAQVDRSLAPGRAGLGVGLSLARQLTELHGGTVTLHSEGLGQGSAFVVSLPYRRAAQSVPVPEPQPAAPLPPVAGAGLQVLLADDNQDYADSLAAVLRADGFAVRVAYDGDTALLAARQTVPDVGLFDIGMPRLDGYALASAVRRQPGGERCLLVAVTGLGQQTDQQQARAAGFDEHLVKPVDLDALLRLLAARASRTELQA